MKKVIKLVFLLSLVIAGSCEKNGLIVNCQECTTEEPVDAEIEIKTDIGFSGALANITIYEGNLEDGVIYDEVKASGPVTSVSVSMNKKYTFTASYKYSNTYYKAVDSATPRVSYNKDQCDDPCYYVYDRFVDLRLKYTK